MQVNAPAGIGPGMPFEVNTPAGLMQVVCPQGATTGSPMLINVPQATCSGAPIVVAQAQYLHPSANEEPILMGTAVSQPIVAPAANSMTRGPMDGRMMEAQSGCYYQKNAPCCMCFYLTFTSDRASYGISPMFCCASALAVPARWWGLEGDGAGLVDLRGAILATSGLAVDLQATAGTTKNPCQVLSAI